MVFSSNSSVYFYFQWLFTTNSNTQKKLPPSPRKLPIIGNLHQLGSHPHRSLHKLSQKHGPVMQLHFGSKPVVVASSVEAARAIMKTYDHVCSNRPHSSITDRLVYGSKDVAFSPYGEYWRQVRSITVLHLLSNKRVHSYRGIREEETSIMIDKIRQYCNSKSVININDLFISLTSDIASRVGLGMKYDERVSGGVSAKSIIEEQIELLGVLNIGDYIPWLEWVNRINGLDARLEKVSKKADAFLESVIEHHELIKKKQLGESNIVGDIKDFVDVLLEIQDGKETGFPLQRDSLKCLILDLFAGGMDTTSTTLEWIMSELMRHPRIMENLQNEVRQLAQGKSEITEDDLKDMVYLKAVIKEVFRLHPPVPLLVPRESMEDIKVMDYYIAAKTQIFINVWAIGRDPMYWENPEEFIPERFLNRDIDFKGLNYEFMPFGSGRRGCPGVAFATAIIELALARLVHNFNFTIKEENLDMTEGSGIVIHKKLPLLVLATPFSS